MRFISLFSICVSFLLFCFCSGIYFFFRNFSIVFVCSAAVAAATAVDDKGCDGMENESKTQNECESAAWYFPFWINLISNRINWATSFRCVFVALCFLCVYVCRTPWLPYCHRDVNACYSRCCVMPDERLSARRTMNDSIPIYISRLSYSSTLSLSLFLPQIRMKFLRVFCRDEQRRVTVPWNMIYLKLIFCFVSKQREQKLRRRRRIKLIFVSSVQLRRGNANENVNCNSYKIVKHIVRREIVK